MENLISDLQAALYARKGEWPKIAEKTGLSYSWVCKLAQGTLQNPTFRRLQTLKSYLDSEQC